MQHPRQLDHHNLQGVQGHLEVIAVDEPSKGGSSHHYAIAHTVPNSTRESLRMDIFLQKGNPQEVGVNGGTIESLLAICIDQLEGFQAGPFPSDYNENALAGLRCAMGALKQRTLDRKKRGVEGKEIK